MIPMPKQISVSQSTDRCDMAHGPCACGAWHSLATWRSVVRGDGSLFSDQLVQIKQVIEFLEMREANQ